MRAFGGEERGEVAKVVVFGKARWLGLPDQVKGALNVVFYFWDGDLRKGLVGLMETGDFGECGIRRRIVAGSIFMFPSVLVCHCLVCLSHCGKLNFATASCLRDHVIIGKRR